MHTDGKDIAAAIDGAASSWRLPLPPLSATSMPEPYSPGEVVEADKTRAAARLIGNHRAICSFAARAAGAAGSRPVSAPLSDPTAKASQDALPHVDAALRHVAHVLLVGTENKQAGATAIAVCLEPLVTVFGHALATHLWVACSTKVLSMPDPASMGEMPLCRLFELFLGPWVVPMEMRSLPDAALYLSCTPVSRSTLPTVLIQ
jgi:hypothetical protein